MDCPPHETPLDDTELVYFLMVVELTAAYKTELEVSKVRRPEPETAVVILVEPSEVEAL